MGSNPTLLKIGIFFNGVLPSRYLSRQVSFTLRTVKGARSQIKLLATGFLVPNSFIRALIFNSKGNLVCTTIPEPSPSLHRNIPVSLGSKG